MNQDIGQILHHWKYVSSKVNVRIIEGDDGSKKIQMRLDLGLLQMEMDGRPDGRRPHNFDSYLSYFQNKKENGSTDQAEPFQLSPLDCLELQQESIQYYHRYLALLKVGDFSRVVRDTARNIRVFDFISENVVDKELVWSFEQYRPYVIMMHTRALASISLESDGIEHAVRFIRIGIDKINVFISAHQEKLPAHSFERDFLEQWEKDLKATLPISQEAKLEEEMEKAILEENYERAAEIRDRLKYFRLSSYRVV